MLHVISFLRVWELVLSVPKLLGALMGTLEFFGSSSATDFDV